ncbi:uncharacterized protein G2W53_039837 [Senna tora]|uniref:Uncharacterized protein n=1 Tax=Senna tora TaxID=362788 RepID=A0A834SQ92_9FABA|nr:uncharacterized protein G2W53_039837 [Senna tora]
MDNKLVSLIPLRIEISGFGLSSPPLAVLHD